MSRFEQSVAMLTSAALVAGAVAPHEDYPENVGIVMEESGISGAPLVLPVETATTIPVFRPWAREFSDDPMAGKPLESSNLQLVTGLVQNVMRRGGVITSVGIEGHASDDDDSAKGLDSASAGLGIANPKNVELADKRARVAGPAVGLAVEAVTGYGVPVDYLPGKEDIDAELATQVDRVADNLGTTALDLATTYNRKPNDLSASVRDMLGELKQGRRVDVTIHETSINFVPAPVKVREDQARTDVVPAVVEAKPEPKPQIARPNYPEVKALQTQFVPAAARRQIQPRNHNFSRNTQRNGGRMSRSHGGNRTGKRI